MTASSIAAIDMLNVLHDLDITHVVTVPDTHQRTLLDLLARDARIQLITSATEDEAIGINAGLWMGGQRPLVLMQQTGLLASLNTVKGIAFDARIPTCMLVGYYGRDISKPARENPQRVVHLIEPTLEAWQVPYFPLEGPADLAKLALGYERSLHDEGPTVVLVGAPTT
jgi:sulfopyruvate decarboxylase TPP-binding subunit